MTLVMIALLMAFAVATALVLADSGLRMLSAIGGFKAELRQTGLPCTRCAARVTTRVSYARTGLAQCAPRRAAA